MKSPFYNELKDDIQKHIEENLSFNVSRDFVEELYCKLSPTTQIAWTVEQFNNEVQEIASTIEI